MANRYSGLPGMNDQVPGQIHAWQELQAQFQSISEGYGFREIRTPILEDYDLFVRSSGEESEVVSKQMFDFVDKGDRHVALRPEGTAPAMRACLEHNLIPQGGTLRLWYFVPFFRYERPQKGRLRQAHQFGVELIGSSAPEADAEVIELTMRFLDRAGIRDSILKINCIGRAESRSRYREALLSYLAGWLADQTEENRAKAERNPLRLFDSKDAKIAAVMAEAPTILESLDDASRQHFEIVKQRLTEAEIPFDVDPRIVRGLDYYTDTVFEVQNAHLGSQSSLCGGGRYDDLIKSLGGPQTPSVGVGIGIERLLLVQEALGTTPSMKPLDAVVAVLGEAAMGPALEMARRLRNQGIRIQTEIDGKSLKAQLKSADRAGAPFCLIVGEDEIATGTVIVRRMSESTQTVVAMDQVAEAIR